VSQKYSIASELTSYEGHRNFFGGIFGGISIFCFSKNTLRVSKAVSFTNPASPPEILAMFYLFH
jgi:hypothetical protein